MSQPAEERHQERSEEREEQPSKRVRLSPEQDQNDSDSDEDNEKSESDDREDGETTSPEKDDDEEDDGAAPPLPDENAPPPLPSEAPPQKDDGWDPVWDDTAQNYYFFNRFTGVSQWENPRVPEASQPTAPPGLGTHDRISSNGHDEPKPTPRPAGGYDPAIHGDYDPTAAYALEPQSADPNSSAQPGEDPNMLYTATGAFNRFTGKWQAATLNPENFNDENKSRRQMNAFFDVDAAANTHDGRSLKAERSGKKLSKKEVKAFREKRREKKEEKRRAWLRD